MCHAHSQGSVEASVTLKNGKDLLIQQCLHQSFSNSFHGLLSSKQTFLLGASLGSWTLLHVPCTAREGAAREIPLRGHGREENPRVQEKSIHLKFLPQFLVSFFSLGRHRDVEILALLLAEQLEPGGMERTWVRGCGRQLLTPPCSSTQGTLPRLRRSPKPSPSASPRPSEGGGMVLGPSLSWGPPQPREGILCLP